MIFEVALFTIAVAVMVVVHRRTERRTADRLVERQRMIDKQAKVFTREAKRTLLEAQKALAEARHVRDDTRALHGSIDAVLRDRRVQRLLDTQGGE